MCSAEYILVRYNGTKGFYVQINLEKSCSLITYLLCSESYEYLEHREVLQLKTKRFDFIYQ